MCVCVPVVCVVDVRSILMCVRACGVCCRCEISLNVCVPVLCVVDVRLTSMFLMQLSNKCVQPNSVKVNLNQFANGIVDTC